MIQDKIWLENYKKVLLYYKNNTNPIITSRTKTFIEGKEFNIGSWFVRQKQNYKENKLSYEQISLLKDINFNFNNVNKDNWDLKYEALINYLNKHGNLIIPNKYTVTYKGLTFNMTSFLARQKYLYCQGLLPKDKTIKLERLGIKWKRKSFEELFLLLEEYYNKNLDLYVPSKYTVVKDGEIINLGDFVHNLRAFYKKGKLSPDKISKLESIGMVWDYKNEVKIKNEWLTYYNECLNYFITNGNLLMKKNYKTKQNGKILTIGRWLQEQRKLYYYNKLNSEQISLLESLNIEWNIEKNNIDVKFNSWLTNYYEACKYYYRYGNLQIPNTYITENNVKLGVWINSQRKDYRHNIISNEKIDLLEQIGMIWNYKQDFEGIKTSDVLEALKEYITKYGTLPQETDFMFTTSNGLTFNLGKSITNIKARYKRGIISDKLLNELNNLGLNLNDEQVKKLKY